MLRVALMNEAIIGMASTGGGLGIRSVIWKNHNADLRRAAYSNDL